MSVRERESKDKKGFVADIIPRIICLFLAIVIWFYVVYNSAPDYEKSFEGIVVSPVNAPVLDEYNLTVSNDILATVDVVIYGKRGDISAYSANEVKATIDFIGITEAGEHQLPITLELPDGATVKNYSPRSITVSVQEIDEQTVPIIAKPQYVSVYDSEVACLDYLGNEIKEVTISGPASRVSLVDHVEAAPICESALSSSTSIVNVPLVACTKDGAPIESDYILISPSTVTVEISLYDEKVVDMEVKNGNALLVDDIKNVSVSPEKIRIRKKIVGGRTLSGVNSVTVATFTEENLIGMGKTEEFELPVVLEEPYENLSGFETVTVTVTYRENSKINTVVETVECDDIRIYNRTGEMFELIDKSFDINVRVPKGIDASVLEEIFVYGYIEDAQNGELKLSVALPEGYEEEIVALGEYYAKVSIAE